MFSTRRSERCRELSRRKSKKTNESALTNFFRIVNMEINPTRSRSKVKNREILEL